MSTGASGSSSGSLPDFKTQHVSNGGTFDSDPAWKHAGAASTPTPATPPTDVNLGTPKKPNVDPNYYTKRRSTLGMEDSFI